MIWTKNWLKLCILVSVFLLLSLGCISVPLNETEEYPNNMDEGTPVSSPLLSGVGPDTDSSTLPNFVDVVDSVRGSVVSVVAETEMLNVFGERFPNFQSGSGVIFDERGYILTNNHVIRDAVEIIVTLDDGTQLNGELVGTDRLTDLAVVMIDNADLPFLDFASQGEVRVGEWVIAIGNALALPGGPSVTVGIVSALGRSLRVDQNTTLYDLIQTDTIINPGNSGGPLLNLKGQIVGINTAVLRGGEVEGIGFAVGGSTATLVSKEIIDKGRVRWAWLGVTISELDAEEAAKLALPAQQGVLVQDVFSESPAAEGGMRPGDIILSIEGHYVQTISDLTNVLRFEVEVGDTVAVEVLRDGDDKLSHLITLDERPSS
ncbi:uncharacterized protein METZ01_LOCUS113863 [marine metagenome]|uniref:PDZ domain-containing protein n=1 Tax=marine metagenome TaxID=408172 RepID=A0A381X8C6_9ZZZZ